MECPPEFLPYKFETEFSDIHTDKWIMTCTHWASKGTIFKKTATFHLHLI